MHHEDKQAHAMTCVYGHNTNRREKTFKPQWHELGAAAAFCDRSVLRICIPDPQNSGNADPQNSGAAANTCFVAVLLQLVRTERPVVEAGGSAQAKASSRSWPSVARSSIVANCRKCTGRCICSQNQPSAPNNQGTSSVLSS
jgi:hypothetical protein